MRGIILIVFLGGLFLTQCGPKGNEVRDDEILVQGKYRNASKATLILENLSPMGYYPLDTVMTNEEGEFEFRLKRNSIGIYRLRNSMNSFLVFIISPGERAKIEADALNVDRTFTIEGPLESELMYENELYKRTAYDRIDSLSRIWQAGKDSADHLALKSRLDSASEVIFQDYRTHLENFIDSNSSKLCSIFAVYAQLAQRNVFDDKKDIVWLEKVANGLSSSYPDDPHTKDLQKRVESIKQSIKMDSLHNQADISTK